MKLILLLEVLKKSKYLLVLLFGLNLSVSATEYIPMGSTWKYKDDGSNQGTTWRDSTFNDASWSSGAAELGFGDSDEATTISDVNQITNYFRKQFTVADASIYGTLDLEMVRDDGAVVYLNGVEIWRDNMPTGTVNYNTAASGNASPEDGIYTTTVSSTNLVTGTNTIAVEVHQVNASSSDVSFDFGLTAVLVEEGITIGSTWKYLDNGSNQGTAWRANGFNDASWSSGAAELGFGDGDEATVISDVNQYSNYFRKEFDIADSSIYETLDLEMVRDDGAVVYLNGTEVWRSNMPGGTINYNTLASSNVSGSSESTIHNTSIPTTYLLSGTNTIAVEVHQDNRYSSDVSFDFSLTPQEIGPYLSFGDTWKYLDDGSNQGTAWRASGFNDASWSSGAAELGYGDSDEATTVSYGGNSSNKHETTYFRKSFSSTGFSASDYFELSMIRDDGAVVYLNGTEIWRNNMGSGSITYTTLASSNVSGSSESTPITLLLPATDFIDGTNVLAVEIHQDDVGSSDISFDFEVQNVGTPDLTLDRGPYLQTLTQSSVIVKWRTGLPIGSFVAYGTSPVSLNDTTYDATSTFDHEVTVSGLTTATKYYYSIGNGDTSFVGGDADHFFTTAPADSYTGLTRAWVLGDAGTANNNQRAVRDAYYDYADSAGATDMILMLGDNAYDNGTDDEYQDAMFEDMYEDIIRQTVTWSCPGNHDMYSANSSAQTGPYYDIFTFPTAGEAGGLASGTEAYYSWDYGQIHFISMDSDDTDRSTGGAMLTWLTNDLAATTKKWIVVVFHHPPYTKGSHDSDNSGDSGGRMRDMREDVLPILESYGVDLVLSGHSHSYERSYFLNGHYDVSGTLTSGMKVDAGSGKLDVDCSYKKTTSGVDAGKGAVYITAGSSGKVTGTLTAHPAMYAYLYQLGSVVVEIEENRMDVKFINNNGSATDYFSIDKDIYNASLDTTISSGNSITLTASWGDDFVWSPGGATTQSISISPTDTTQYIVKNGSGCLADTFNVNVVTVNTAPTANDDVYATVNEDIAADVLLNDFDDESNPITITAIITAPNNGGTATINNNGTPANPADDYIDYSPSGVYFGVETFDYSLCDNGAPALCDTATVSVTITENVKPVATNDTETVALAGSLVVDVLDNDNDANGQDIEITSISSAPDNGGTAIINDNGTAGDPTDDYVDYTSSGAYVGDEVFEYIICDNGSPNLCDTASVTVTITTCPDGSTTIGTPSWDFGAEWKYDDSGTDLDTAWRNPSYIDDCWSYGNGSLGFNNSPTTTLTNHGGVTYYFRKHFNVTDKSLIDTLTIELIRDDGAIVYINGTEVLRSNMPSGAIDSSTLASSNISGSEESEADTATFLSSLLVDGDNVIAVEVHQDYSGSSDIDMDLKLSYTTPTTFSFTYETISGKTFIDADFNRALNSKDIGSGALVVEAYQDNNNNGVLDATDPWVANGFSNAEGDYAIQVYPPTVQVVNARPLSSGDDAIQDKTTGAVSLSAGQLQSADVSGSEILLFDSTSTWKYYDSGFPGSTWMESGFSDAGWSSGAGDFGFGDGYANTTLTIGESAFYFRKQFTISGPNGPNYGVALSEAKVDDGIVVYINGKEIFRQNMPDGNIEHSTLAAENVANNEEERIYTTHHLPNPEFVTGVNTIAVEVHQFTNGSSDMHFDMRLSAYDVDVDEVGLRFPNVVVEPNANIVDAWITMKAVTNAPSFVTVHVEGEAADNSSIFTTSSNNIGGRSRTSAETTLMTNLPILANQKIRVPNLGPIIQEIIDRPGWSSGNALSLITNGFTNEYLTYDGDYEPVLMIAYSDTSQSSVDYLINIEEESIPEENVFMTEKNPLVTISEGARVSGINIGYLGTTSMCVAAAEDTYDDFHIINRFNGANTQVGEFGGSTTIESIALSANADTIFAVDEDSFGLVDFTTGEFTPYGTVVGTGNGSIGSYTFSDIDGLAYDLENNILYASERRAGSPLDIVLAIDHTTGLLIPNAFGVGIDYIIPSGVGILGDIDDIAVNPNTGKLFAMNNDNGTLTKLIEIDLSTGTATEINSTGLNDMEGQGFHNDGKFYSTSGRIGKPSNVFYEVDTATAALTPIGYFASGGDFEGCDCKSGPYISFLEGIVFSDLDENGVFDGSDELDEGVTVYLYEDLDDDGIITVADTLISSRETDTAGGYFFGVNRKGVFLVIMDTTDIPPGSTFTTTDQHDARFSATGNFDFGNNFGYRNAELLPVELASFYGEHVDGIHHLHWMTSAEINNSHFNVFRSSDGIFFEGIGKVDGAGNSNTTQSYNLNDNQPLSGQNYYRLQQVDFDGTSEYSKTIVLFNGEKPQELTIKIWPNPAKNQVNIDGLEEFLEQKVSLKIVDLYGKVMVQNEIEVHSQTITIDINNLNKGYYIIEVSSDGIKQSISFIKQ